MSHPSGSLSVGMNFSPKHVRDYLSVCECSGEGERDGLSPVSAALRPDAYRILTSTRGYTATCMTLVLSSSFSGISTKDPHIVTSWC